MVLGGEHFRGWYGVEAKKGVKVGGRIQDEIMPEAHHFAGIGHFIEKRAAVDRTDGVQLEKEGGDDAEITPAAAHSPEQVFVLMGVCGEEAAVSQYDIHFQEIINRQSTLPGNV